MEQEQAKAVDELLNKLQNSFPSTFSAYLSSPEMTTLLDKYNQYVTNSLSNPMFEFWSRYIQMVQLLLLFVRASREGNWELHLSTLRSMMPWFMAYMTG